MAEIREFFSEGNNHEESHVLLHITEPSTPEEKKKGYFFAVCEINHGTLPQIEHLQELIDELETGYYSADDTAQKTAFEKTLETVNRRGHIILREKESGVHCLVGTLRDSNLSLSCHGAPIAKLFYTRQGKMLSMDIIGSDDETSDQLFSAVVEGPVNGRDTVYLASPHTAQALREDMVRDIVESKGIAAGAAELQRAVSRGQKRLSFGGLLIGAEKNKPEDKPAEAAKAQKIEMNYRPRGPKEESFISAMLITVGRTLVAGVAGVYRVVKRLGTFLIRIIISCILIITNKGGQRHIVLSSLSAAWQKKKNYIHSLPLLSKILAGLALIFVLIFFVSIGILRLRAAEEAKRAAYQNEVQAVEDKRTAAEAGMLYGDDAKALELLREASAIAADLPAGNKEKENTKNRLLADVAGGLLRLRKIKTITPTLISDLASVEKNAKTFGLTLLDRRLIAFGPDDKNIYTVDLDTKRATAKPYNGAARWFMASTPKENDKVVLLAEKNILAEYQKSADAVAAKTFDVPASAGIAAIFVYNQRLYSVDRAGILRKHAATQTGYDRGSSWLRPDETADFSDAVALAIDGDLFVLKANGAMLKLAAGRAQQFNITGLDPAMDHPAALWTYNEVNYLYILEPTNKRVILLDKNGKLIQQYTASEWQNPTGMAVDEVHKTIYVLDSNKIYSFVTQ